MLEILVEDVHSAIETAWSSARLSPFYRWCIDLIDDTGRVIIRLLQNMTEPANTR